MARLANLGGGSSMLGLIRLMISLAFAWRLFGRMGLLGEDVAELDRKVDAQREAEERGPESKAASTFDETWGAEESDEDGWAARRRKKSRRSDGGDWKSDSRRCILRDMDELLGQQPRWEWQRALDSDGEASVMVEVARHEESAAELNIQDVYELAHQRIQLEPGLDAFVLVDLRSQHVAVVEGNSYLKDNFFGRSNYNVCMRKNVKRVLREGEGGESARADIGRRDIAQRVPKLLRSLDSILHGRACGPQSTGGLQARFFTISENEVYFAGVLLIVFFIYARNTNRKERARRLLEAAVEGAQPEPEPASKKKKKKKAQHNGPTLGKIAMAALSPLIGSESDDDDHGD